MFFKKTNNTRKPAEAASICSQISMDLAAWTRIIQLAWTWIGVWNLNFLFLNFLFLNFWFSWKQSEKQFLQFLKMCEHKTYISLAKCILRAWTRISLNLDLKFEIWFFFNFSKMWENLFFQKKIRKSSRKLLKHNFGVWTRISLDSN